MATLLPLTALQRINLQAQDAWANSQQNVEANSNLAISLRKQLSEQQGLGPGFIQPLTDPRKDKDVRVVWLDFCAEGATDCTADDLCGDLSGAKAPLQSKDYAINQCIEDSFEVSETDFAGSFEDLQNMVAASQNQKIRNILERLNTKLLLAYHANAGFNRGGIYTANVGGYSEVPASQYNNTDLVVQLITDAEKSQLVNPFYIDSGNLYKTWLQAKFNQGNMDGKGEQARADFLDMTFDLKGMAKAGATVANSTFAITPYALAFVNKNYYTPQVPQYDPTLGKDKWFFTIPNYGIRVDVLHQRVCESGRKDRYKHIWHYNVTYDFLTNPFGCPDANGKIVTGIVEYRKVADV